MAAQIKTWGNSRGVRLSKDILESIGARPDDFLDIEIKNDSIVLSKAFKHRTLEERAVEFDGKIGPYNEFEWNDPVGRKQW